MKVAVYARYSSDNQRDASIADQLRICREFAARHGWTVVQEFTDHAISGATLLRSGFQALMRDALNRRFDIVLAESLDRFSRDQEDTAGLFKRLTFAGVNIVTLAEGDITHLHIGFKGTMNAVFLKDLAEKTHRGLRGRVENGKAGGGLCYGYRVVRTMGKYKHHVEWFTRDALLQKYQADTKRGEKVLARDLYAYLHDQGLEFSIEASSASGEADLVSAQTGDDRLVADAKIFDPGSDKGIPYLCRGFAQVYQYTQDYNDPFGYLVVFKTCREDLAVNAVNQESAIPYFTHNNKTIFVVVIDLCDHPEPASKRGQLKTYALLETQLVQTITETQPTAAG